MIRVMIEPSYGANLWAQAYLTGIHEEARKKGYALQMLTDEDIASDNHPVLLVGSTVDWLKTHQTRLAAQSVPCVIAGIPPQSIRCGFAAPDYDEAIADFAFRTSGNRALFAVHPSSASDEEKKRAFQFYCPEGKIYENQGNLIDAAERLVQNANQFQAVLCANDVAAMMLRRLLHDSASPWLFAFGEQALPSEEKISLFRMDLFTCGTQALHLCRKLEKEPYVRHCVWVPCHLDAVDAGNALKVSTSEPSTENHSDFYLDPHVEEVFRFKALLTEMDELDLDILRELLRGARYFDMAESLHTTENTIKYRLKRMNTVMGLHDRAELLELAHSYLIQDKLSKKQP